jgi:6-phosphofructokinase 1
VNGGISRERNHIMTTPKGKLLVAQAGGPTAVINQSLAGVVREARRQAPGLRVHGALRGVEGIIAQDLVHLSWVPADHLEQVALTPSAALLSTRDKPAAERCARIFETLKAHDVRWFIYIGGNDSADTLRIISEAARDARYELRCLHVPKTIDNDLVGHDHTPGYGSAARFVALAFAGANLDNRALPGVHLLVVMGRHAGFLTAASALGRVEADDGPHLVYLHERPFDTDRFLADVERCHRQHGRCVVAVSEGIADAQGMLLAKQLGRPVAHCPHGNPQLSGSGALGDMLAALVREKLALPRVRADTLGYLQRSFPGVVSDIDQAEARAVGEFAVRFALAGTLDGSVAIQRTADYAVDYQLLPLDLVAARTRRMPNEFIAADRNDVTGNFVSYARPLLGRGMPRLHRLRAASVKPRPLPIPAQSL